VLSGRILATTADEQITAERFWSKVSFKSKELFARLNGGICLTIMVCARLTLTTGTGRLAWTQSYRVLSNRSNYQVITRLHGRTQDNNYGIKQSQAIVALGLCNIGGVLRSNPVTDFLKLRIGRPHFLVHYPCKLFVFV